MENSNETNQVPVDGQVASPDDQMASPDGQMANVSLDDETGLYSQDGDSQGVKKTRSWKRGWLKKKETTPAPAEPAPATKVEEEDFPTALGNFGASFLNFCTFGLLASGDTTVEDTGMSADKIVQDLASSEAQLTMIDEETAMTNSEFSPARGRSLMTAPSVHSDAESNSHKSMISRIAAKRNKDAMLVKVAGIVIFLAMIGLFVAGGIFLRRNGW